MTWGEALLFVVLPALFLGVIAREVRRYKRDVARGREVQFAPTAARQHGSRRPVPPEPRDDG